MATPDDVDALAAELSGMQADWQLHAYGNTRHAFTNPDANDPAMGTVYSAAADRRSWISMKNFLQEVLVGQ
jgi:dienelactone hydrolase